MPENTQITFSHREIIELLIKERNIHEGVWRLTIVFGLQAVNFGSPGSNDVFPSAIVPVQKIGIQRVGDDELPDGITVDAAKVNPPDK